MYIINKQMRKKKLHESCQHFSRNFHMKTAETLNQFKEFCYERLVFLFVGSFQSSIILKFGYERFPFIISLN